CMVLSITPTSTFAEISPQVDEGNVCTHHLHDEKCGYTQALAQVDCDKNCTDTNDDGVIDHTADCAYSPAVAANKCNFDVASCEICHPKNGETADAGTALPGEIPVLAKTDAPTTAMATVAKLTATQPSVSFVLDNKTAYTDTATWAVYDSETATTAREDIVASCNANTLTLAHKTDLPVAVYYVAVTEGGKAESARLALTVEGNVMPVALLGAVANSGEIALDPSVQTFESGTTYTVSTAVELAHLATLVNDATDDGTGYTVKLLTNIDLSGIPNWTPIGKYVDGTNDKAFVGTFDGCGFEVQNLTINNTSADNQGLFGYVGDTGIVQNVGVTGTVRGNDFVGGVVGTNTGSVQNCYSTATVNGNESVGGVVGDNSKRSENCNSTIQNCYNTGTINGNNNVGGVLGFNFEGTVKNCYNTGAVTSIDSAGGIVGGNFWNSTVQNCYNTGTVSGGGFVGGVVGTNIDGCSVLACVSLGSSNTGSPAGRVVGLNDGGTLGDNKARSDMLVNNATVTGAADNTNGADVIVGTALQPDVFSGWDAGVWAIPTGKLMANESLPTLTGFKNVQNPTLPAAAAKEGDIPLDSKITTLKAGKSYTIADSEQLVRLANLANGSSTTAGGYTVKLLNDIDLSTIENWAPIGNISNNFAGTFDGCGHE
ncbi:MAG: GLUG motif-containing protein, partial [Oscillospiraceae bacterium]